MPNRGKIFYSVVDAPQFVKARDDAFVVLPVTFPERLYWSQCAVGSELIILSATIPTKIIFGRVVGRGILSTPYYGKGRSTLAVYFAIEGTTEVEAGDILFRLAPGTVVPLNDLRLYSVLREFFQSQPCRDIIDFRDPEDLIPYTIDERYRFAVSDGLKDAEEIIGLARHHPFGIGRGDYEFVLRSGAKVIGAMQVLSGESEHNTHHLQRAIFKENYERIFRQSLTVFRLHGPENLDETRGA